MHAGEFRFSLSDSDVPFPESSEIFKLHNPKIESSVFSVRRHKSFAIFSNCWNPPENKIEMKLNFESFELE